MTYLGRMGGSEPGPTSVILEGPVSLLSCDPFAERGHRGGPDPPFLASTAQRPISEAQRKPPPGAHNFKKAERGGGGGGIEKSFI